MNRDVEFNIATAPKTNSRHWKQETITWGEMCDWVASFALVKEAGNYVMGLLRETSVTHKGAANPCRNLHRRKEAIVSRSALTLDVDYPEPDLIPKLELIADWAAIVHTTYSSAPDSPRYRLIIPTDRDMAPDEYMVAANAMMSRLGYAQFDPSTNQPERYMYLPGAQYPDWAQSWILDGDPVCVDDLLADEFDEDLSMVPFPEPNRTKRDPFDIDGVVGAFNRAYHELAVLISEYDLPYEPDGEDRWHLIGTRAVAGMGEVRPGLYYSHHSTDPAHGVACTAFDLVRLHRFGELDDNVSRQTPFNRLPSYQAMQDLAAIDARVTAELVGVDFDAGLDDDDLTAADWKLGLRFAPRTGKLLDSIDNWDTIRRNEPVFLGLYYNELTMAVETDRDLPWRPRDQGGPTFNTADRANLAHHIEREYRIRPARTFLDELVSIAAHEKYLHPIKEYLQSLEWDGASRVETCLPGAADTPYNRLVARKSLVAAVARIMQPGCKWDHTLILFGSEGLGKSFWVDRLARGHSATLGNLADKDTLITMQRSWILVSDEGHSLRKSDADATKEFLTRTVDVMRMPYDREARAYPRRCVIWGTTNDEVFLRRQQGNRRFLIVRCEEKFDFDIMTDNYVDQLWAEAVELWRSGELLFLDSEEALLAQDHREPFIEEDALAGLVHEYLETLVPDDWSELSPEARSAWMQNRADGLVASGTQRMTTTCSAQVWVEALGRRFGDHRRIDLLEINKILHGLDGWKVRPGRSRVPGYGPQVIFARDAESSEDADDLLG